MAGRAERWAAFAGLVAVALWVIGVFVIEAAGDADTATGAEALANYRENANGILTGSWIFMAGCLAFIWFAIVLRDRLALAETAASTSRMFSTLAFVGAVTTAAFLMLTTGPDIAASISEDDLDEAAASAMATLGDAFFVAAEMAAILLMLGVAGVALRTGVLPRAWAWFSLLLALILIIGPIGWAALVFGLPLWTIGTTLLLMRNRRAVDAHPMATPL